MFFGTCQMEAGRKPEKNRTHERSAQRRYRFLVKGLATSSMLALDYMMLEQIPMPSACLNIDQEEDPQSKPGLKDKGLPTILCWSV